MSEIPDTCPAINQHSSYPMLVWQLDLFQPDEYNQAWNKQLHIYTSKEDTNENT